MILITGGMGFIGVHVAQVLLARGEEVVITHYRTRRLPPFLEGELGKRLMVETLDVTSPYDTYRLMQKYRPAVVIHLAVPGLAALSPEEEMRVNTVGLTNVLGAARMAESSRILLASSIAVYDGIDAGPFTEEMLLPVTSGNATSAYKKVMEVLGLYFADQGNAEVVALRIGYVYGPYYHSMANLPSRMVHAAVLGEHYFDNPKDLPSASQWMDLCYVEDCAQGIALAALTPSLPHRIYNISGGEPVSAQQLHDAVAHAVPGWKLPLRETAVSPSFQADHYMSIARAHHELGYQPQYDVFGGIAKYIRWALEKESDSHA